MPEQHISVAVLPSVVEGLLAVQRTPNDRLVRDVGEAGYERAAAAESSSELDFHPFCHLVDSLGRRNIDC
jgi:hypothetical protein